MPEFNIAKTLEFGTPAHDKLVGLIKKKMQLSSQKMRQFHPYWDDAESKLQYYIHPGDVVNKVESRKQIIVPLSFLSMYVKLALTMSIFFNTRPPHKLEGRSPEDVRPAKLHELVIDAQMLRSNGYYNHYRWFMDAYKYGIGINHLSWQVEHEQIVRKRSEPIAILGIDRLLPKKVERTVSYEGVKLTNVDPYAFLPDPRFPITDFQKGEFCGYRGIVLLMELNQLEREGKLFNTKEVKPVIKSLVPSRVDSSGTRRGGGVYAVDEPYSAPSTTLYGTDVIQDTTGFVDIHLKLIPDQYDLTDSEDVETWHFIMSDNDVIVNAEPHNFKLFPYGVVETYPDGYSLASPGEPQYLEQIEEFATWLLTSRKENVKKVVNDVFVYDPRLIDESSLKFGEPGLRIKLNPAFLNRGIDNAIRQMAVVDVTTQHLQDIKFLVYIFELITGVSSTMLGSVMQTGRKSATEIRGATQLATMRVKNQAELFSAMGVQPVVRQMVQFNQAELTHDMFVRIVGADAIEILQGKLGQILKVRPKDILGGFDYPPIDGTIPLDRLSNAQAWLQLFQLMFQDPTAQLAQRYNPDAFFKEIAQHLGVRNIQEFVNQQESGNGATASMEQDEVTTLPDETIAAQAQQGNLVRLSEVLGRGALQ